MSVREERRERYRGVGATVRVARGAALAVGAAGAAALSGWALGVRALREPFAGSVDMKANTAVGFVLAGWSLWLATQARGRRSALGVGAATLVAAIGALTLAEYLLGVDLGIDQLLFDDAPGAVGTVDPGRLAPQTAGGFVLGGAALALLHTDRDDSRAIEMLALPLALVGALGIVGTTYGSPRLEGLPGVTPIAPFTALAFLALSAGLIAAAGPGRIVDALGGQRTGSVMARRLLLLAMLGLPLLGWLHLEGQRRGWYGVEEGVALLVLSALLLLGVAILGAARLLNRWDADQERRLEVERRLAVVVEASSEALISTNAEGLITSWNLAAEELFGHPAAAAVGHPIGVLDPPNGTRQGSRLIARALTGGEVREHEAEALHRDGRLLDTAWTVAPIRVAGVAVGAAAIVRDVGERRRARLELERLVGERTAELAASRAESLRLLARAAEYRDDDTYHHTERVGRTAAALAQRLGMSAAEVSLVRDAAPLHDIGKLAVPDSILLKPGRLTEEEFEAMKTHTTVGGEILRGSRSDILQTAERIALYHHERWDGQGYPMGLSGEEIPLVARVVAVADVYDALTHERPYKRASSHVEAIAEIVRGAGKQFDPRVVAGLEQIAAAGLLGRRPDAPRLARLAADRARRRARGPGEHHATRLGR